MRSAKFLKILMATFAFAAIITFLAIKYADIIFKPYYNYRRARNLPDAAMPDFEEDFM